MLVKHFYPTPFKKNAEELTTSAVHEKLKQNINNLSIIANDAVSVSE